MDGRPLFMFSLSFSDLSLSLGEGVGPPRRAKKARMLELGEGRREREGRGPTSAQVRHSRDTVSS